MSVDTATGATSGDRSELEADLQLITDAHSDTPTIDDMIERHPDAVQALARRGAFTVMMARHPGSLWHHLRTRRTDRTFARHRRDASEVLEGMPGYEAAVKAQTLGPLLREVFGKVVETETVNPNAKDVRRRWGRGRIIGGMAVAQSVVCRLVPGADENDADMVSNGLQALRRSKKLRHWPATNEHVRDGRHEVVTHNLTEHEVRAMGRLAWNFYSHWLKTKQEVKSLPTSKRSLDAWKRRETLPPWLEQILASQNDEYLAFPAKVVTTLNDGELSITDVAKDKGLLAPEVTSLFQIWRNSLVKIISELRGGSHLNREQPLDPDELPLYEKRASRLSRRRAKSAADVQDGPLEPGPESLRDAAHRTSRTAYSRLQQEGFQTLAKFMLSSPKGVWDLAFSALRYLPAIVSSVWHFGGDVKSWFGQKKAAKNDPTIRNTIAEIRAQLG